MAGYRVAPIFLIRAPGASFEHLENLGTPRTTIAARQLLEAEREFERTKRTVELILRERGHGLAEDQFRAWRTALRRGHIPPASAHSSFEFEECRRRSLSLNAAEVSLVETLEEEVFKARNALLSSSKSLLPSYLVFTSGGVRELLTKLLDANSEEQLTRRRNAKSGDRERHLLLYLQRVCAKNDTFSQFGPSAWGFIQSTGCKLSFEGVSELSQRQSFFERWTTHTVAAEMNQDPDVRAELPARLNPNGILTENSFLFLDTGNSLPLPPALIAAARKCDGVTSAYALDVPRNTLERLASLGVLLWQVEVPALQADAMKILWEQVGGWRPGPARERWLDILVSLMKLPTRFVETVDVLERLNLMNQAWQILGALGAEQKSERRFLYSAGNPIAEECARGGKITVSERLFEEFVRDAEPWIDLWRDTYAFVASRVSAGLRALLQQASEGGSPVSLPAFLHHCQSQGLALEGPGMVVLAATAFNEVRAAFSAGMDGRTDSAEISLTEADCHLVRNNFQYEKFDEYTYPSADLQISAASLEAIEAGIYMWVLGELHPPPAMLHHCFYWSCPNPSLLAQGLSKTAFGIPNFHYGFRAADFTSHTTVHIIDALPELSYFVAPQRSLFPDCTVSPSEADVFVNEANGDVGIRERRSGRYLGSFTRGWLIPLGFHPFCFGRAPHMPRLKCGSVVVQRRSWTVNLEEIESGKYEGVSFRLVLAVERLREKKGWPRFVYTRPTERALRRSGAEGRDKDTKPIFIDLESYLSLEVFYRWLVKAGELEVTEMLPDPDHLCWQEADGRRTFELRTLIVPR